MPESSTLPTDALLCRFYM